MKKEWLVKTFALTTIVLFIQSGFASGFNNDNKQESINNGDWLYVGGSGEGNYTKIQDAIDNASDGDTVFVYDDSSPYYENLVINKHSINLIGEDKNTTVIERNNTHVIISISVDNVTVSGFTIQNAVQSAGIYISSNSNKIIGNNICFNTYSGIQLGDFGVNKLYIYNVIKGNTICNNGDGIKAAYNNFTIISDNVIDSNSKGVYFGTSMPTGGDTYYCTITRNTISNNEKGIFWLGPNSYNLIIRNTFQNNSQVGVDLVWCDKNRFEENNFIHNELRDAFDQQDKGTQRNVWVNNYWDSWIGLKFPGSIMKSFPKIIPGFLFPKFDQHPAQEPYDI